MSIFTRLRKKLDRSNAPHDTLQGVKWLGTPIISPADTYDNLFPYVNAVASRFSTIIPYAVTPDGQRIKPDPAAVRAIYSPNRDMSCLQFLRLISTTILTQSHLDILVWQDDNGMAIPAQHPSPDQIIGYTPLPINSRVYNTDGSYYVQAQIGGTLQTFSRDQIISLSYSRHPVDPSKGISPAMTATKWATIDDMLADYQRGFFENGAVPAGVLNILSTSAEDFQRNKERIEDAFRGAGNANGVAYNMVPVDQITGKPADIAKLTWTPFQQPNNTLDLNTLNRIVTSRLASAIAVPDIARGIDNGQTYANAQQAERSYIENTIKPLCMLVWDGFQFELDRITGGLGYTLNFDLDIPAQVDSDKVQADTNSENAQTLINLVNNGATVQDAVTALGLPPSWSRLTLRPQIALTRGTNARPKGEQAARYYLEAFKRILAIEAPHALTRDTMTQVVIDLRKQLSDHYSKLLIDYARHNAVSIMEAIKRLSKTRPDLKRILDEYPQPLETLTDFDNLPHLYINAYQTHLQNVANHYVMNVGNRVQKTLSDADLMGWDAKTLKEKLTGIVTPAEADMYARSETVQSQRLGSLYSARNMSDDLGVSLSKTWHCEDDDACPYCQGMDGTTMPLTQSFTPLGGVRSFDGTDYVNDFEDQQTCDAHPNCRCYMTYEVQ